MPALQIDPFINRCIRDTLSGLRDGLTLFSGHSRTALIFSLGPKDGLYIFDPQNLMRGYEPILKARGLKQKLWSNVFFNKSSIGGIPVS